MAYVAALLIIGLCGYLVAQPFFSQKRLWKTDEILDDLDELSKEHLFATLNELEMEYNMGKLPEEDYRQLKKKYEILAAEKIKEESKSDSEKVDMATQELASEELEFEQELEREIAEELRQMKVKKRGK